MSDSLSHLFNAFFQTADQTPLRCRDFTFDQINITFALVLIFGEKNATLRVINLIISQFFGPIILKFGGILKVF